MPESVVQVTEGTGKKLHTFSRVIGTNTIEDEAVYSAEFPVPSYVALSGSVAVATANSHLLQLMAGASLNVRIRRITVRQAVGAGAVTAMQLQVFRLTTAGTGGGVVTARPLDSADAAAGATAMTLPTVKGAEGVQVNDEAFWFGTAAIPPGPLGLFVWEQHPSMKPLIIPAGAANGIAIKNTAALAAATVTCKIEFSETAYL